MAKKHKGVKEEHVRSEELSRRVTVRDIAREVGVHFTTVAEALRDSPRVKAATKEKVLEAAKRLGYRADPMLAALSTYRTRKQKPAYKGVLAWINGFEHPEHFSSGGGFLRDCYMGASERSERLGYKLEPFWLAEPGMTGKRASHILYSRNTSGVIVGPMPQKVDELKLDWQQFCSLRIGYSVRKPALTTVIADQFSNVKMLYRKLVDFGFSRIGFACPQYMDDRVNFSWSGGYLAMQQRFHSKNKLDPYLDPVNTGSSKRFLKWFRKNRPEVLITGGGPIFYNILREATIAVPEDVQVVSLHADHEHGDLAGIQQNGGIVGMVAVDQLVAIIHRFQVGLEVHPKAVTIGGDWVDGGTFSTELARMKKEG